MGGLKNTFLKLYALRVFIKNSAKRIVERFYKDAETTLTNDRGPIVVVDNDNNCPRSQCGTKPNTAVAVLGFPYRNARLIWPTFKRTLLKVGHIFLSRPSFQPHQ